ncbi:MAG TPA: 2-amino-4-hydroxy-6-hydroxymethyldihydropteridine diphosphokinase, partial [Acidimicrobiales bacterium]|nr:2-amino-4-hydroxy-6-hydroxymethyldihydropteridine diphosphokinase [Acidimicrobiales bacterium]
MTRVLLGLGSNLGDRAGFLRAAVDALPGVVGVSDVYETEPVGGPEQGRFLNIVVALDLPVVAEGAAPDELAPADVLALCQRLEQDARRVRQERWGPRTLDVDVLWIDGIGVDEPDLQVPHPRMFERRFVLAPLAELAPDLLPEGWEQRAEG